MQTESSNRCVVSVPLHNRPARRLDFVSRWPSLKAKQWVETFVDAACSDSSLAAVVLLGSAVRPVKQVNDVDVLYIYKDRAVKCPGRTIDIDLGRIHKQMFVRYWLKGTIFLGGLSVSAI